MPTTFFMGAEHKIRAFIIEKDTGRHLKLKWRPDGQYLRVKDNGECLFRLRFDEIVHIQRCAEHLNMTAYPLIRGQRQKKTFLVQSDELNDLEKKIRESCAPQTPPHRPSPKAVEERRYLILINPFAGQKQSNALWEKTIRPLCDEMGLSYNIRRTEYNGHAVEIIQQLDIENYVGVAVLSGDGLISEVLNGLLRRLDYRRALKFPIIHIPTGTSNALAAAIAYQSGEPFSPRGNFVKEMTLMASRPLYRSLSLCHVQTSDNGEMPMFMSTSWGLIADIDLGSERFRNFGMIRLHLEAFIRIVRLPHVAKYPARISYKPVKDKQLLRNTLIKAKDAFKGLGRSHFIPPDDVKMYNEDEPTNNDHTIENAFKGAHLIAGEGRNPYSLDDPVPDDWITIEGEFVYVCLSSISHLGSDLPYIPSAKLEEEVFYLTLVDWKILKSRLHIAHLLITIDRGDHLNHGCLHVIPVIGCRVEPLTDKAYFAVDGEPCKSGRPFQVLSTNLKATVIGRSLVEIIG